MQKFECRRKRTRAPVGFADEVRRDFARRLNAVGFINKQVTRKKYLQNEVCCSKQVYLDETRKTRGGSHRVTDAKKKRTPYWVSSFFGGRKRTRTADLLRVKQAL